MCWYGNSKQVFRSKDSAPRSWARGARWQQQPVDRREGLRWLEQRAVRGACAADESRVGLALNESLERLVTHRDVCLFEQEVLAELRREDRVEVGLHLLVLGPLATGVDEFLYLVLELASR